MVVVVVVVVISLQMRVKDGEGAATTRAWLVSGAHPLLLEPQTTTQAGGGDLSADEGARR